MNALKKTLFIIAVVFVSTYSIRHAYYNWIQERESVLDKYSDSINEDIKNAKSLEQLVKLYDTAKRKVDEYEKNEANPKIEGYERDIKEPYKSEQMFKDAIKDWEGKTKEIFEIRFYWIVGFVLLIIGYVLYKKVNSWLGLTVIILGFAEQVYWTSPTWIGSSSIEYDRLLINKFIFSITTLILLITIGYLTDTLKNSIKQENT